LNRITKNFYEELLGVVRFRDLQDAFFKYNIINK